MHHFGSLEPQGVHVEWWHNLLVMTICSLRNSWPASQHPGHQVRSQVSHHQLQTRISEKATIKVQQITKITVCVRACALFHFGIFLILFLVVAFVDSLGIALQRKQCSD